MNSPDDVLQKRSGGQILVDCLVRHGVDLIFCVPGESYLAVLDALYDERDTIKVVQCRQEGGASYMAEAYGKLTRRPGIAFVTRGPGAANASIGLQVAQEDATPMILFIGQVPRPHTHRGAFQEMDFESMFSGSVKWAAQIQDAQRIPEYLLRAFQVATSGRPGPVVLALPEDMLEERVVPLSYPNRYFAVQPKAATKEVEVVAGRLKSSRRPLLIVGGSNWTRIARDSLHQLAVKNSLPVATAFRRKDLFDNTSSSYVGDVGLGINPSVKQQIDNADLIILIGTSFTDAITGGYKRIQSPRPKQEIVHVDSGAEFMSAVCQADVMVNSEPESFVTAIAALDFTASIRQWRDWTDLGRHSYERFSEPIPGQANFELSSVVAHINKVLPSEAIITNGAGNYTIWLHRYYQHSEGHTLLAPGNGSMGYGVPAAIAAQLVFPKRRVLAFSGDGCFLMNGQELATAVQQELPIIFIVANNNKYGTIRMYQDRLYPGRTIATDLKNPDFAAYANAFGAAGFVADSMEGFKESLQKALDQSGPSLIELRIDYDGGPSAVVAN